MFCEKETASKHTFNQSIDNSRWPLQALETFDDDYCHLPQYLDYFSILGQLGVTALTRISYLVKMFVIASLVIAQCCLNIFKLNQSFRWYDERTYGSDQFFLGHDSYLCIVIATIAVALFIMNRQVNKNI